LALKIQKVVIAQLCGSKRFCHVLNNIVQIHKIVTSMITWGCELATINFLQSDRNW